MRFILVGGLNTLITMGLFYGLTPLLGYVLAYSLVYVCGTAFANALNSCWRIELVGRKHLAVYSHFSLIPR
jgi:putative flippase GtrA